MRRILASILLAVISFPLIASGFRLDAPKLKACCLRNGQHRCEMADMDSATEGPAVLPAKCASWPVQAVALIDSQAPSLVSPAVAHAPAIASSAIFICHDSPFVTASKAPARKRGPPSLFA